MAFPQGATFVFGSRVCITNGSGSFDSHLANPITLKATSSESYNDLTESDDHGDMLLPDLAKEIEQKLEDNSGSTRTRIDSSPNSTRVETLHARPIFGLRNASSTYQQMIKSSYEQLGSNTLH